MANNFKIVTPHAAVIVWNYDDRVGAEGVKNLHGTETTIISTLSCISIQTSKVKGQPEGTFQLTLAPYKNWVSTITAGSWCCIMMSNKPITEQDLKFGNKDHIKMIGKIETVRVNTSVKEDGSRQTIYNVSGVDWGHIFNNIVYVDNLIAGEKDPKSQGNAAAIAIQKALFAKNGGTPQSYAVKDNLRSLINIFGQRTEGFTDAGKDINRLAKSIYNFNMPDKMVEFLNLKIHKIKEVKKGKKRSYVRVVERTNDRRINNILNLVTGTLKSDDTYVDVVEAYGFINPFSLQGQHTFWQILLENSNPALNEMLCEMRWDEDSGLYFTLYNRIKPFSYKNFKPESGKSSGLRSYFQYVKRHDIDDVSVISVNAGTNWRDKYNFIEIKPEFQDFNIIANWYKQKSQKFDSKAFEREGFRPLIIGTKQFPVMPGKYGGKPEDVQADFNQMTTWVNLLKEWYFDTHRTLNGTIVMQGTTDYIAVGDNIRFDAGLINPTPNINSKTAKDKKNKFVLAHVEGISHSFSVNPESGARTYTTTIQFVRGIIVSENGVPEGQGILDKFASSVSAQDDRNTANVISTSDSQDPDPQKVRGR